MSDRDSFISEVSEEVRRDRLFAFLRRWGWLVALVLILVIGGTGGVEWRRHLQQQDAMAAGDALRTALSETDPEVRAEKLAAIAEGGSGMALVARFAEAGSFAEAGEPEMAGDALAAIAETPDMPELYRALARLERVMVLGDAMAPSERLATLESLTSAESPFRVLALEQRAVAHLDEGDKEAAIADLEQILTAAGSTEAAMARSRQLIVAAGGALPVDPAGGPIPQGASSEGAGSAPADG